MINQQIQKLKPVSAEEFRQELLSVKQDYKKIENRLAKYKKEDIPYFMRVNMEELKERIQKIEEGNKKIL